ncbi:MAG: hypothetical protein ABL955_11990 [Elusimicrobiota bacterium]
MRRVALLAAALAAACSQEPGRPFPVGFLSPVSPLAAAEAVRLGFVVSQAAPAGSATEAAGVPGAFGGASEVMADRETLRFLAARAVAKGAHGVFFRLPAAPDGRDLVDYPEEWQALIRVVREMTAMQPLLERGRLVAPPFAAAEGLAARAWIYRGRRYALLVNVSGTDAALESDALASWRVLYEVRSDARELLKPCGAMFCLPPHGVLWLEGRLRAS